MRFPHKVPVGIGVLFAVVWIGILMSSWGAPDIRS